MAYYEQPTMTPVINAPEEERAAFLVRVYQHVGLAVAAFIAFETVLFMTPVAQAMYEFFAESGVAWLALLGVFMIANWFASNSVQKLDDPGAQYMGLFAMAAAYSVLFAPFLYYVFKINPDGGSDVWAAAVVTGVMFAALSVVGFVTRRDLSFLRPIVMWGFVAAFGLIVVSVIFGMQLGLLFSVAMVALAGAAILYQTQTIVRHYPAWAHVGAAVALFGSLMTMFWYVLRIFSSR